MIEHHIQRGIIDTLMRNATLRFSELKPDGMESNIFMYHLKQLMTGGYVEKIEDGSYRLAHAGLQYVDGLSSTNLRPRKQPKLIVILAIRHRDGRWLLAERKIQPYIGERMFLSGKQHFGETFTEHAERELRDKIGVDAQTEFRGIAEILIRQNGTVLTQVVAHVHSVVVDIADLPADTSRFSFVWHDFNDDSKPLMAGTAELHEILVSDSPAPFMVELVI